MTSPPAAQGTLGLEAAFAALRQGFADAARRLDVNVRRLRVGSQLIELRVAGPAMADAVLPALTHLEESGGDEAPDLVVMGWDTASADLRLPDLPPVLDRVVSHVQQESEVHLSIRMAESMVSALHAGRGEAVHCVADGRGIEPADLAHPISEILAWWLARSEGYRVHAAAVGTAAGGVLLAGASGAGKSTSALACLHAGMRYAGDDQVLVRPDPPTAISLYNTGRGDRELMRRFPEALPQLELPSGAEKSVRFFSRETVAREIPLRAVVMPRVVPGGRCRLMPASRGAALLALAPWVVVHATNDGGRALAAIRRLVMALPVYRLDVGDDLASIPVLLSELVEESTTCS